MTSIVTTAPSASSHLSGFGDMVAEFHVQNLRHLRFTAVAILVINVLHILIFLMAEPPATALEQRWHWGVVTTHAVMAVFMVVSGLLAHAQLRSSGSAPASGRLVLVVAAVGLAFCCLLAVIDQWVTPNITPVMVGSICLSLLFLIPPRQLLWVYGVACVATIGALGLTQNDPALLLNNRVNVLTIMVMGWVLARLLWHKTVERVQLQRELQASNEQLRRQEAELRELATHDPLTRALNRRAFFERGQFLLQVAQRHQRPLALIAIDLDHFKHINDVHGHPAGDAVLRRVAEFVSSHLRQSDLVARYGGEEFMVLLPDTDLPSAQTLAEKLRAGLADAPFPWEDRVLRLTSSFGVTASTPVSTMDDLYAQADKALYLAKQAGRNRVEVWGG